MITIKNYFEEVKKIGVTKLPETLKKSHELVDKVTQTGGNWNTYNSNETIKRMIDLYITKLNEYASQLKPSVPAGKGQNEQKPKFKEGQTVYSESNPNGLVIKNILKRSKGMIIPGSGPVTPLVAYSYVFTNGDSMDESYLTSEAPKKAAKPKTEKQLYVWDRDNKMERMTEQEVIDLANTVFHYDQQDDDVVPIVNISTAMKALNKESDYSVSYTNSKPKKVTPKAPKTRQAKAIKQQKVNNGTPVERVSDEISLLKRFLNFHNKIKNESQVLNLLNALQKAIVDKRISKTSSYSAEVEKMQENLVTLYSSMNGSVKVELSAKMVDRLKAITTSVSPMIIIRLIKRFIGMQGKAPAKEKVERLQNDLMKYHDSLPIGDKYYKYYAVAANNVQAYLEKSKSTIPLFTQAELNGLSGLGIIVNKAVKGSKKCSDGKYTTSKKQGRGSHHGGIKGLGAGENPFGKRAYVIEKENPLYKGVVEIISPGAKNYYNVKIITPPKGTNYFKGQLEHLRATYLRILRAGEVGFIPSIIAAAAGKGVEVLVRRKIRKDNGIEGVADNGVMSINEIESAHFDKVGLTSEFKTVIGDICKPTSLFFYGAGGSKKSTAALRLAEEMNNLGNRILYVAKEQYGTPTFTNLLKYLKLKVNEDTFKIVRDLSVLDPKNFDVIVLDSKDACGFDHSDKFEAFKREHPAATFIITSEAVGKTGKKTFRGDEAWRNKVDSMVYFENGVARTDTDKNRWGGSGSMEVK